MRAQTGVSFMGQQFLEILGLVRHLQRIAFHHPTPRKLWYRGQAKAEWGLRSKLHRDLLRRKGPAEQNLKALRDLEASYHLRFRHAAWPLLTDDQRRDWGLLFSMQHYSVVTRLLDWTMSFACALHFAQRNRERTDDAVIFVVEPETANKDAFGFDASIPMPLDLHGHNVFMGDEGDEVDLDLYHPTVVPTEGEDLTKLRSLCVLAPFSNPRMVAQRGVFMLCGNSLDEVPYHQKIVLPANTYDDAEDFLALAGVDEFTYFPDLHGLGQLFELNRLGSER